jgi:ABC-type glutathione transport system ATPase component
VGDAAFQKKCFDHFMLLKKNKKTVVLVTHDMGAVRQYCDRALMINNGVVVESGKPEVVAQAYQQLFAEEMKEEKSAAKLPDKDKHWGSGKMVCLKPKITLDDKSVTINCTYKALQDVPAPVFGFTIFGPAGNNILEGNTLRAKYDTRDMLAGEHAIMEWVVPNIFATGVYDVSVACCDRSAADFYDWFNEAVSFTISKEGSTAGAVDPALQIADYHVSKGQK